MHYTRTRGVIPCDCTDTWYGEYDSGPLCDIWNTYGCHGHTHYYYYYEVRPSGHQSQLPTLLLLTYRDLDKLAATGEVTSASAKRHHHCLPRGLNPNGAIENLCDPFKK